MIDKSQYEELFRSELRNYLDSLNNLVVQMEKEPDNKELLNETFRIFHTIKGMAGSMEYEHLVNVSHSIENLLDKVKTGEISIDKSIIDKIFMGIDEIDAFLSGKALKKKEETIDFDIIIREDEVFPAVRAFTIVQTLKSLGDVISTMPSEKALAKGEWTGTLKIKFRGSKESIIKLKKDFGEIKEINFSGKTPEKIMPQYIQKSKEIRVDIDRLDKLQNLVGELVISKENIISLARSTGNEILADVVDTHSRYIQEIQDEVMRMRMVPVSLIFNRFPRYIRELANNLGKDIDFNMEGIESEIDRSLLDSISEPVLHLLRNAVDHAIEPPEERIKRGKTPKGKIILSAKRMKDSIYIEVIDDGRGIDKDKVLKRAVSMGWINDKEVAEMTEGDIFKYIFTPGFSTAEEITELSGRGVGLDVVKATIRSIGGNIDVKTEEGKGTTFRLKIPLTMAVIRAFLVKIGEELFAIPIVYIEETVDIKKSSIKKIHQKEVYILRKRVIPVLWLSKILNLSMENHKEIFPALLLSLEGKKLALVVDEFKGSIDIVVKMLSPLIGEINIFSGVTILENGKPVLIIDVPNVV